MLSNNLLYCFPYIALLICPDYSFRSACGILAALPALVYSGSRDIWGWLWFSCGMGHSEISLISIFQEFSSNIHKAFILGGAGRWAIVLWGLDRFLIFTNFLISQVLSRSATREAYRIYHVYK